MQFLAAVVTFVLKLMGWSQGPKASVEAVAASNAAQERTVAQVDAASAETQAHMAQAAVDAPSTQAEVAAELDKGEF